MDAVMSISLPPARKAMDVAGRACVAVRGEFLVCPTVFFCRKNAQDTQ
jgi:hypothetical protein